MQPHTPGSVINQISDLPNVPHFSGLQCFPYKIPSKASTISKITSNNSNSCFKEETPTEVEEGGMESQGPGYIYF